MNKNKFYIWLMVVIIYVSGIIFIVRSANWEVALGVFIIIVANNIEREEIIYKRKEEKRNEANNNESSSNH